MELTIKYAQEEDIDFLSAYDHHVTKECLYSKVISKEILIAKRENDYLGWLRFNYFWDNTPFMNLLWVMEPYRQQGIGHMLVVEWEKIMISFGYENVMTSTMSNETSQHFYRKLGYKDIGGFVLNGDPFELMLEKKLI